MKKAVDIINRQGALLVFPINNRVEPASLWSQLYPKSKMQWVWDEDGDNRVGKVWSLMKRLSDSRDVVYSKWYQGRATFFSKKFFTSLLRLKQNEIETRSPLSRTAIQILDILENDSPLSTKQLKKLAELQGKDNEKFYNRAMKELFKNFHIVAFGEVDDGAFPSLAIGATRTLFENLWVDSQKLSLAEATQCIDRLMPRGQLFRKYLDQT